MKKEPSLLWPEGAPFAKGNGVEDCPRITPFTVDSEKPVAAVIVCPGGGYGGRAWHEGEPVARWLNSIGINSFLLDYRVAPYQHPCELMDIQRAIRYIRFNAKKYNIDPKRLGAIGFSAGGHLVSSAGTHYDNGNKNSPDPIERENCRPDLIILSYAVISFGEFRHEGTMYNLLGNNPTQEMKDFFSNEKQVTPDTSPAFLWHTRDDDVAVENSMLFAESLKKCGVPFELHIFESGPHGIGLGTYYQGAEMWPKLCENWLTGRGFIKK